MSSLVCCSCSITLYTHYVYGKKSFLGQQLSHCSILATPAIRLSNNLLVREVERALLWGRARSPSNCQTFPALSQNRQDYQTAVSTELLGHGHPAKNPMCKDRIGLHYLI